MTRLPATHPALRGSQLGSDLEATFAALWRTHAPTQPAPVREHAFAPPRRWRFDFAWPAQRVAVEIEGGVWSGGRHTRPQGYEADLEKYNCATAEGWRVLRATGGMLERDPLAFIALVIKALEAR